MKAFLVLLLLFPVATLTSTPLVLSEEAEVSLLTCAPGNELYSLFGHTALRVLDPVGDLDVVFNYGTFDFATPGFYLKFARGLLTYQLSCTTFLHFMDEYYYYQRDVREQVLLLDSTSKQRLWEQLAENYLPENRAYLYNFLHDNCTTRARDLVATSIDGEITWPDPLPPKSAWEQLDEYLHISPWTQWGIHVILGQPATATTSAWERMFLPDYLATGLEGAHVDGQPMVRPERVLHEAPHTQEIPAWYLSPLFVFSAGTTCLVVITRRRGKRRLLRGVAFPFFVATGMIGCLLSFLGGFTLHPTTAPNANLLWANPLNLIATFFFVK